MIVPAVRMLSRIGNGFCFYLASHQSTLKGLTIDETGILISDIRSFAAKNQQAVYCSDAVQDQEM